MQRHRFLILASWVTASAFAAIASACGGADNPDLDGGGDATTADGSQDSQASETGSDATPTPEAGKDAAPCSNGTNCRACCAAQYPDAEAFFTATEETCGCTTPGACKNECANTLCKGVQPGLQSPCEACLFSKDAGGCFEQAAVACQSNAECQQLAQCVASCGGGPVDAGGGG